MEQIRIVMAVVLSILVFLIWDYLFVPHTSPQQPKQHISAIEAPEKAVSKAGKNQGIAILPNRPPSDFSNEQKIKTDQVAKTFMIDAPLYSAKISGSRACFTEFDLKRYKETTEKDSPDKHLVMEDDKKGTGCVHFEVTTKASGLNNIAYFSNTKAGTITIQKKPEELSFSSIIEDSVMIEKRYTFYPDSYVVGLEVIVKNDSGTPVTGTLALSLNHYLSEKKESRFVFAGPCTYTDRRLEEVKISDIKKKDDIAGKLSWVAIQTRYFITAIIPNKVDKVVMHLSFTKDESDENSGLVTAQYRTPPVTISPHSESIFNYKMYLGPKDIKTLQSVGGDLDKAVNFGWFDFIARPCLWLMNQIYRIIPNYGIAIILVTLIIKLLFWPLGTKSYKSMAEMKKIQPLMAEIREKYKDDKKKMNEEMMGLYKTYKVNPLGGCLPMIIQIPVFIAFYRMLYQAIELRHAPFLLWINDLSAPERLFSFNVSIPFMQPPIGIPVLTIIMGATMFLQQKMQPPAGDPSQAKMMMLMPIFLTVIFINFPSGLVLYFITNNLFSIFQQRYVTKKNA